MILLLQPKNKKITAALKVLESLNTEDFEVTETLSSPFKAPKTEKHIFKNVDMVAAFTRSYMMRDELEAAKNILEKGLEQFPENIKLMNLQTQLEKILSEEQTKPQLSILKKQDKTLSPDAEYKKKVLESWLANVRQWKRIRTQAEDETVT